MNEIKEWKYDFAWKQLENAQLGNDRLDNKAMSVINFSSLIIPIITGILLFVVDKQMATKYFYIPMVVSLFLLILSIFFAFIAIWLRDQGIIFTKDQFSAIGNDDIDKIKGNTAEDLADWQKKVVDAGKDKGFYLLISNITFLLALISISVGTKYLLFF